MYSNIINHFCRAAKDINESYMQRLKDLFFCGGFFRFLFTSVTGAALFQC